MNETNWMQQGWECPKCGAVMSPHTACCVNCRGNSGGGVATTIPSSVEEIDMRDLIQDPLKYLYNIYTINQVETTPEAYYTDTAVLSPSSNPNSTKSSIITGT
jgi:hypothetical protein